MYWCIVRFATIHGWKPYTPKLQFDGERRWNHQNWRYRIFREANAIRKHIDCMWYFISMGDSGSRVSPMSSVENRDATNIVHNRQSNNSDPSARSGNACRNTSGRRWCVGMGLSQELFPPIPAHGVSSCLSLYKGPVWVWGVIDGYSQYSACKNRVHGPYRHIVGTSPELHVHTGEWSHSLHPWVLHPWVVTGQWALAKFLRFGA